jgi:hypothetical protein
MNEIKRERVRFIANLRLDKNNADEDNQKI